MTNEEKVEWLRRYHRSVSRIDGIEKQIEELRMMELPGGLRLSDMPKGTGLSDLSEYGARFDELDRLREEEIRKRDAAFTEIALAVNRIEDADERRVLQLFFLSDDPDPMLIDVCRDMSYERTKVFHLRTEALNHLVAD